MTDTVCKECGEDWWLKSFWPGYTHKCSPIYLVSFDDYPDYAPIKVRADNIDKAVELAAEQYDEGYGEYEIVRNGVNYDVTVTAPDGTIHKGCVYGEHVPKYYARGFHHET